MHLAGWLAAGDEDCQEPVERDRRTGWLGRQNLKNKEGTLHMVFFIVT